MTPLAEELVRTIQRNGPISVADYMNLCLAHPTYGYYRRADPLGAAGDFVTAPEISQMFGELLGLWAAEIWSGLGQPDPVRLVELGPGRSTLMSDALRAIEKTVPAFRAAIDLHLVEISPRLRAQQAAALRRAQPTWHEDVNVVPSGPAIIFANEFFDALPVRQFERRPEGWRERCIDFDAASNRLAFKLDPVVAEPPIEPAHRAAPIGTVVEVSPTSRALARALGARLAAQSGAALIIDYGPLASGSGETLQSVRSHRKIGPLDAPGESDLTAHVDFMAIARAAREAGAAVYGPVPQGVFLHRLGLAARAATLLRTASARQADDIAKACGRLIGESEMGSLFKALAIVAPGMATPPGFDPLPDP